MTNPSNLPPVIGIDVGTSGVRSLVATADGEVLAEARAPLFDLPTPGRRMSRTRVPGGGPFAARFRSFAGVSKPAAGGIASRELP